MGILHRARIILRHCALIEAHLPERAALLQLKKHLAWYSSGRPFGARLRPLLFAASSAEAVQARFWQHWGEAARSVEVLVEVDGTDPGPCPAAA